jgi:hypothetical protein
MNMKKWLQLFRAQTAPATVLLVLTAYLFSASFLDLKTLLLTALLLLVHLFSFGHNSLMDAAMHYDQGDPNKQHHPLVSGIIKFQQAHNVIHWGLGFLSLAVASVTILIAQNPLIALLCLIGWTGFGHAYNDGLSKESLIGFLAISLSMTAAGAWGWFLSNEKLTVLGGLYLGYVFCIILYQISWSGFIKEMQVREHSNILSKMGAELVTTAEVYPKKLITVEFYPGASRFYAYLIKGVGLIFASLLCWYNYSLVRLVTLVLFGVLMVFLLHQTTKQRAYNRGKELLSMSLMEIATIYLAIPLMLNLEIAALLMLAGIVYFFLINVWLWGVLYPKV